jgi:hypothetical protein
LRRELKKKGTRLMVGARYTSRVGPRWPLPHPVSPMPFQSPTLHQTSQPTSLLLHSRSSRRLPPQHKRWRQARGDNAAHTHAGSTLTLSPNTRQNCCQQPFCCCCPPHCAPHTHPVTATLMLTLSLVCVCVRQHAVARAAHSHTHSTGLVACNCSIVA